MRTTLAITTALLLTSTTACAQMNWAAPKKSPPPAPVAAEPAPAPAQPVQAAREYPPLPEDGDILPPEPQLAQEQNGIQYATGGVGEEELAQIESIKGNYNLRVLSTVPEGNYLGDFTVYVLNAKGEKIFEAPSMGPYFYLNLPAGSYTVQADKPGAALQSQKVTLGGKTKGHREVRFRW